MLAKNHDRKTSQIGVAKFEFMLPSIFELLTRIEHVTCNFRVACIIPRLICNDFVLIISSRTTVCTLIIMVTICGANLTCKRFSRWLTFGVKFESSDKHVCIINHSRQKQKKKHCKKSDQNELLVSRYHRSYRVRLLAVWKGARNLWPYDFQFEHSEFQIRVVHCCIYAWSVKTCTETLLIMLSVHCVNAISKIIVYLISLDFYRFVPNVYTDRA